MTTVLEHLRRLSIPASAREIAESLNLRVEHVEAVLNDLKRNGEASLLNSGRWEATMLMPQRGPLDARGSPRKRSVRLPRLR